MLTLVERSLFKTGNSLAVTLPIRWLRRHHLGPGDMVEVILGDDLVIRSKRHFV